MSDSSGGPFPRQARYTRKTKETDVSVMLNLDGQGIYRIDSGIPFLDHMLSHLAVHGCFDIDLSASGDLQVDNHHTIEDIAIGLGSVFEQASGDRKGIARIASAYAPMDETLAFAAVDFSGRPYCVFQAEWLSPLVGGVTATMFQHFFESFAISCKINLHARVLYGRDDHHKAEALFKALARSLDEATRIDPRRAGKIPSTKGTLVA